MDTEGTTRSGHTPAPWKIEYEDGSYCAGQSFRVGPARVSFSYWSGADQQATAEANARLIAAAPELLAACRIAKDAMHTSSSQMTHAEGVLRAAIAKAEGGAS